MRRGTIFVILFIIVAAAVIAASQFLRSQPPLKITLAVDPLAADWARDAVTRFNATQPIVNGTRRVEGEISVVSEVDVWRGDAGWTADAHPDGWLPSTSVSVAYAQNGNIPVTIVSPSVARTVLVWGGYESRVSVLTQEGSLPLDWQAVANAAAAESWAALGGDESWRFFKLGFSLPTRSMNGLAVLFSGAAYFGGTPNLVGDATRSTNFFNWLQPIIDSVPNFQTLGGDTAKAVARGPSTVEIALLPENQWLLNLNAMVANETVHLHYPAYQFVFDFPVAAWDDPQTTSDQRAGVRALADWLLTAEEQANAVSLGLRPAAGEPPETAQLFAGAEPYGIQLNPDYGQAIQSPDRTEAQGLILWFTTNQRR